MSPDIDESIRCSVSSCSCVRFQPRKTQLRSCVRCGHGWVAHALEKLQAQPPSSCGPVEVALPGLVFDLSSLILYGAQAIPVRLKILLDRLYSVLTPDQVNHILHTLGWSLGDYVRGYMLQHPSGKVLDRWDMVIQEEELIILKQFLRFGETRPTVELMTVQCLATARHLSDLELNTIPNSRQAKTSTDVERIGKTPGILRNTKGGISRLESNSPADHGAVQPFEGFSGRLSLLLPVAFPNSEVHCLVPSTKELVPSSKPTQYLQNPSGTKPTEQYRTDGERRAQDNESMVPQPKGELALQIKVDPDKPLQTQSLWNQHHQVHNNQEPELYRGKTKPGNASLLCPTFDSRLIPSPSALYPPITLSASSTLKSSQRMRGSSFPSLRPLPSFSSSFLCSPPNSPFSSSLQPPPSSLCSLPSSPAVGRKGRVCCGVCGKSFYDKGTLKIHYNAVHLKIKHHCTVPGCTMVFSSLRSRNRHSANPNPRLHTSSNRHMQTQRNSEMHAHVAKQARKNLHSAHTRTCRARKVSTTRWQHEDVGALRHGYDIDAQDVFPPPSPHPLPQTVNQDTHQNLTSNDSTHKSNPHPADSPPSLVLTAQRDSSLGLPPSFVRLGVPAVEKPKHCYPLLTRNGPAVFPDSVSISMAHSQLVSYENSVTDGKQGDMCTSPVSNLQRWESGDLIPKKKPRKSSMPVKIERENLEERRHKEEKES